MQIFIWSLEYQSRIKSKKIITELHKNFTRRLMVRYYEETKKLKKSIRNTLFRYLPTYSTSGFSSNLTLRQLDKFSYGPTNYKKFLIITLFPNLIINSFKNYNVWAKLLKRQSSQTAEIHTTNNTGVLVVHRFYITRIFPNIPPTGLKFYTL